MSAITPSTIVRESQGSKTLLIISFSSATSGDTYTNSALASSKVACWANADSGSAGVNASSTGYIFNDFISPSPLQLFVLANV